MATQAEIINQQVIRVGIVGPNEANTQIITNGLAKASFEVNNQEGGASKKETFTALLEPALEPGQFRRAIATGSLAQISFGAGSPPTQFVFTEWGVNSVEADLDDESGKVELRFDVFANAAGFGTVIVSTIAFQVITLAAL